MSLLWLSATAFAQGVPEFDVDYMSARTDRASDRTRVDFYTKIPFSQLRFVNRNGQFHASYEVNAEVYEVNSKAQPTRKVLSVNWDRTLTLRSFSETQADLAYDNTTNSVELTPGNYVCQVTIEDRNSNKSFVREFSLLVRNFSTDTKPVLMSDLMLVDEFNQARGSITPNVSNMVESDKTEATFFFEVYTKDPQNLTISYTVQQLRNTTNRHSARNLLNFKPDGSNVETIGVANWSSKALRAKSGRNPALINIPMRELKAGSYLVRVLIKGEANETLDVASKIFNVQWTGLETQLQDVDKAISQLRYIAKDSEVNAMRAQGSNERRMDLFMEFWKKRDPTPGTRRNEAMEEYYYRIYHVNKQYGHLMEGWETDQGEVYVRFGEPTYVQRHPYNFGTTQAYEVWYYENIGKKFIFIDKNGLGDYKLMRPIWDERNRM